MVIAPFIASMFIVGIGVVLARGLERDLFDNHQAMPRRSVRNLPASLLPDHLTAYVALWVDRFQVTSLLVPPVLAMVYLDGRTGPWWAALAVLVATLAVLVSLFVPRDATQYGRRTGSSGMSAAIIVTLLSNGIGLVASVITS